jgi:hypothetical protein
MEKAVRTTNIHETRQKGITNYELKTIMHQFFKITGMNMKGEKK